MSVYYGAIARAGLGDSIRHGKFSLVPFPVRLHKAESTMLLRQSRRLDASSLWRESLDRAKHEGDVDEVLDAGLDFSI